MMIVVEILIVIATSAAIVAAVGGLVYVVVLAGLEELERHRHTLANAQARRARTQSQLPPREAIGPLPRLAGRAGA